MDAGISKESCGTGKKILELSISNLEQKDVGGGSYLQDQELLFT